MVSLMDSLDIKYEELKQWFINQGSAAVAFSAGVDSTLLLYAAHEAIGDKALAVSARFCLVPQEESRAAEDFCKSFGIKHIVVPEEKLPIDSFHHNPENRCYLCKRRLMSRLLEAAGKEGADCLAEGSNTDDLGAYRPGMKAVEELGVKSPFLELGFSKAEIRVLSKRLALPTADKPSLACLASRFAYGYELTPERLDRVDRAERYLHKLGFGQLRVRISPEGARIEVMPREFEKLFSMAHEITEGLGWLGFERITADLKGYQSGSFDNDFHSESVDKKR